MIGFKRLQYSPFDILVALSGIACVALGIYFISGSFEQTGQSKKSERFGVVKRGEGTRKLNNSLKWSDLARSNPLYYGDVIFANGDKDIEIELLDKSSKLVVPEDSMIKITKSGDEFDLDVSQGSIVIKTKEAKKIRLRDKKGQVRNLTISKDSDIKISSQKSNVTVEAIKGQAELRSKKFKNPVKIKKDKILVVGNKKTIVVTKEKIVATKVADPLFDESIALTNKFKTATSLEISRRRRFERSQKLKVIDGQLDIKDLDYGRYYVRGQDKTKMDSFKLVNRRPLLISVNEKENYYRGDVLNITWNGRSGIKYKVEISEKKSSVKTIQKNSINYKLVDGDKAVIKVTALRYKQKATKTLSFKLSELIRLVDVKEIKTKQRTYHQLLLKNPRGIEYKVEVKNRKKKKVVDSLSTSEKFLVKVTTPGSYNVNITSPKFKQVDINVSFVVKDKIVKASRKRIFYSGGRKLKANLKWKRRGKNPEKMDYIVKLFRPKDKEKPFLEEKTKRNNFVYKSRRVGRFFWKVESTIPDLVESSSLFEARLSRPKIPRLQSPKLIFKYDKKKKCYQFRVPRVQYASRYDIHIFTDRSRIGRQNGAIYHKFSNKRQDCLLSKKLKVTEGKYYYKYRIVDRWNRRSRYSPTGIMFFPISPLEWF